MGELVAGDAPSVRWEKSSGRYDGRRYTVAAIFWVHSLYCTHIRLELGFAKKPWFHTLI